MWCGDIVKRLHCFYIFWSFVLWVTWLGFWQQRQLANYNNSLGKNNSFKWQQSQWQAKLKDTLALVQCTGVILNTCILRYRYSGKPNGKKQWLLLFLFWTMNRVIVTFDLIKYLCVWRGDETWLKNNNECYYTKTAYIFNSTSCWLLHCIYMHIWAPSRKYCTRRFAIVHNAHKHLRKL